jgi:hypothetical protein
MPDETFARPPENITEIYRVLGQQRCSLSPTRFGNERARLFQRKIAQARNESDVQRVLLPLMEGDVPAAMLSASQILFAALRTTNRQRHKNCDT